jgi:hypothetical protein
MLNERQLKIAEALLKHLESRNGKSNYKLYTEELGKLVYSDSDVETIVDILTDNYGLTKNYGVYTTNIGYEFKDYYIRLTPEGNKAVEIGIKKYEEELEYDKQLERDAKVASIKTSRWAIGISFMSLVIAIAVPFLVEKCKNDVPTKTEPKNQVYDTNNCESGERCKNKYVEHTGFPNKLTDSSLIEKLKDSIKHDTKFLNELKLELRRNTTENKAPNP